MTTTEPAPALSALNRALRREPGRPLVTYDDRRTGERVELSVVTFDNWVSKIANLLSGELDVDAGCTVSVRLPTHWQTAVAIVGAWAAGLTIVDPESPADVVVVGPEAITAPESILGADCVIACSLRPLGGRFVDALPAGWLDFALEVPPQPDALLVAVTTLGSDLAVKMRDATLTHAELADHARLEAARVGLAAGGRLATDLDLLGSPGLQLGVVAPLVVDAAAVLVSGADDDARSRVVEQELATCTAWLESPPSSSS